MQMPFNQLSIAEIINLSEHFKKKCTGFSSFEEVAQGLMAIFGSTFITEGGKNSVVLSRFFKSCTYGELPDDIRDYIRNKSTEKNFSSNDKYLTLLGSYGELDNWKDRKLSKNYIAMPIHSEHMLEKFPMLSAVFNQIGLKPFRLKQTDKSIIMNGDYKQYGVFCVENADGSKQIPAQAEFVRPYSVKSVFGFGGIYSTSNVYAVIIFSKERISREIAKLFLGFNPAIKQITLAHEVTKNIFKTDRKDVRPSKRTISPQQKEMIEKEMALTYNVELQMTNKYLLAMSKALRESHEKFRNLVENTADWIWEVDEHYQYTYASPQVHTLLGYRPNEVIGMTIFDLMVLDNEQGPNKLFSEKAKRQETFSRLENNSRHKDGHTVELEISGVPIFDSNGSFKGYRGTNRDITEHKRTQRALMQSEKLKAMGVMTSGISHEFNNILAVIKGFSLLLQQKYEDHKEIYDKIEVILKSVTDGSNIVDRMINFTREEVDNTTFTPLDVGELVEQVIELLTPRWKTISEANEIMCYIDKKDMKNVPKVWGDGTELRQVVLNIINNSLDAMPEGGRLSFRTRSEDGNVILSISDTGVGMYDDIRKNIFDPFLTTKMLQGAGLGMSICYGIIKRHGGDIDVESVVGGGTTVTIRLPISKYDSDSTVSSEQKCKPGVTNLRILVIDDEPAVCEFLCELLSQEGQNVKSVCCGKDAIELLKSESFDIVLCDLVMPETGSREVIKMLNTLNKRPVVGIVTGWSEDKEVFSVEDMKVDFIVKKPFDPSDIMTCINIAFNVHSR